MHIRLTKSQSIILAIVLIGLFFVLSIALIKQNAQKGAALKKIPAATPDASGRPAGPEATPPPGTEVGPSGFVLHNFQRAEIKDGRKLWEVKAAEGLYEPTSSTFKLSNVTLWVFRSPEDSIKLDARTATLYVSGTELKSADISGAVKVARSDGTTIETEHAIYDRTQNFIQAPGRVRMQSNRITITGNNLTANVATRELNLGSNVTTTIAAPNKNETGAP